MHIHDRVHDAGEARADTFLSECGCGIVVEHLEVRPSIPPHLGRVLNVGDAIGNVGEAAVASAGDLVTAELNVLGLDDDGAVLRGDGGGCRKWGKRCALR